MSSTQAPLRRNAILARALLLSALLLSSLSLSSLCALAGAGLAHVQPGEAAPQHAAQAIDAAGSLCTSRAAKPPEKTPRQPRQQVGAELGRPFNS
jgi:hypothetical protein